MISYPMRTITMRQSVLSNKLQELTSHPTTRDLIMNARGLLIEVEDAKGSCQQHGKLEKKQRYRSIQNSMVKHIQYTKELIPRSSASQSKKSYSNIYKQCDQLALLKSSLLNDLPKGKVSQPKLKLNLLPICFVFGTNVKLFSLVHCNVQSSPPISLL